MSRYKSEWKACVGAGGHRCPAGRRVPPGRRKRCTPCAKEARRLMVNASGRAAYRRRKAEIPQIRPAGPKRRALIDLAGRCGLLDRFERVL